MTKPITLAATAVVLILTLAPSSVAEEHDDDHRVAGKALRAVLTGFQEVPPISTTGRGVFEARLLENNIIDYQLRWEGLQGEAVIQAHIHFGQRGVNGGPVVFLCQTSAKPDPTSLAPDCSTGSPQGGVRGMITPGSILNVPEQGLVEGEFEELVRAMFSGNTYVNVHTQSFGGGEIRGQITARRHGFFGDHKAGRDLRVHHGPNYRGDGDTDKEGKEGEPGDKDGDDRNERDGNKENEGGHDDDGGEGRDGGDHQGEDGLVEG